MPLPNVTPTATTSNDTNNYLTDEEQVDKFEAYMLRVDHTWNNKNHSFVNLRQNHWVEQSFDPFGASFYLYGYFQTRINKGMTIDHTVTLNKDMVLDLNYNVIRYLPTTKAASAGYNPSILSPAFSSTYLSQMQFETIPEYSILNNTPSGSTALGEGNGVGTFENGKAATTDTNQDFNGSITHTFRNHTFRYGAEYMIQQEASSDKTTSGGTFTFGNATGSGTNNWTDEYPSGGTGSNSGYQTSNGVAEFVLGLPNGGSIPTVATGFWSQHYMAFYFQDDWRVNSKLTVNAGLRWDYEQPVTERFNRFAYRFDPNYVVSGVTTAAQANYATLLAGSSASNTGLALLQTERPNVSSFVAMGGLLYAGTTDSNGNPVSRNAENPIKKYFQPRLGFAYNIRENTVIRGGLGRFVQADFVTGAGTGNSATGGGAGGQTGYSQTTTFTPTTNGYESAPAISLENPFTSGITPLTGNSLGENTNIGNVSNYTDPNIGRVYVDEASAAVQQQYKGFLFEVGFTLEKAHGLPMNWEVNDPPAAEWHAAYDPQFNPSTATVAPGGPVLKEPGATTVSNPFYKVAGMGATVGYNTSSTEVAYDWLRPNPVLGNLTETRGTGNNTYYAMNTKVERRFKNGWSVLQSFSWSKEENASNFIGPQTVKPTIYRQLSTDDKRFHYVLTPIYQLPFGRGKQFFNHANRLTDELIGGWSFNGIYQFQSGEPLVLPTNINNQALGASAAFFEGRNPGLGKQQRSSAEWFNTSMFAPIPSSSTCAKTSTPVTGCSTSTGDNVLANYPSWTGVTSLPGSTWTPTGTGTYAAIGNGIFNDFTTGSASSGVPLTYNQEVFGNIRNPYVTDFIMGARKSFAIEKGVRFELGMDVFNVFNHPQFGSIDVNPAHIGTTFGELGGGPPSSWVEPTSGPNSPRLVQLRGVLTF